MGLITMGCFRLLHACIVLYEVDSIFWSPCGSVSKNVLGWFGAAAGWRRASVKGSRGHWGTTSACRNFFVGGSSLQNQPRIEDLVVPTASCGSKLETL